MDAAVEETGAVVMGRRTFEMADPDSFVGNYEFQVPIFVVTHHPPAVPPRQDEHLTFTFVTEGIESAIEQARSAAGDKVVQVVGGPSVIQQLLGAGLVDDLRIDVMPVVLGDGLRLLENLDPDRMRLEKVEVARSAPERVSASASHRAEGAGRASPGTRSTISTFSCDIGARCGGGRGIRTP